MHYLPNTLGVCVCVHVHVRVCVCVCVGERGLLINVLKFS